MFEQYLFRGLSLLEVTSTVTSFLAIHFAFGSCVSRLLKLPHANNTSLPIAIGLAITTVISWYAFSIAGTLRLVWPTILYLGAALFLAFVVVFLLTPGFRVQNKARLRIIHACRRFLFALLPIVLCFSVLYLAVGGTTRLELVLLGNNDPYSWAIGSDRARSMLAEIHGTDTHYWNRFLQDAFGTYSVLGLMAQLKRSAALEAIPYFLIMAATLNTLAIYEFCARILRIHRHVAFVIAFAAVTSPFFFYISFHGFLAQLLASFASLVAMRALTDVALQWADARPPLEAVVKSGVYLAFPMILLLICYQSAYVPSLLLILSVPTAFVLLCARYSTPAAMLIKLTGAVFAPLALAILISFLALPQAVLHLVHRVLFVASVVAGWELPLLNPLHLLGIPLLLPFGSPEAAPLIGYVYAALLGMLAVAACLLFWHRRNSYTGVILGAIAAYCGFVVLYLVAFFIFGTAYQVWKLASFTLLPLSFVPFAASYMLLEKKFAKWSFWRGVPVGLGLVIGSVALTGWTRDPRAASVTPIIENLVDISASLKTSRGVVLDMPAYAHSMIAMNMLKFPGEIIPLSRTYFPVVDRNSEVLNAGGLKIVRRVDCLRRKREFRRSEWPATPVSAPYGVDDYSVPSNAYYAFNRHCSIEANPHLSVSGLSYSEDWGRWSDGPTAKLVLTTKLDSASLLIRLRVVPFWGGKPQNVSIGVDGSDYGEVEVPGPGSILISVATRSDASKPLTVEFTFPDRVKLTDIDASTEDPRVIALGFVDMEINAQSPAAVTDSVPNVRFQSAPD